MSHLFEQARVELRKLYRDVEAELMRSPELYCDLSGRCCRFAEAGHELFLTRFEYGEMVKRGGERRSDSATCPWLTNGLCGNREGRALACRTYFCSNEEAAAAVTERFHAKIRAIHDRHGVPYQYRSLWDLMTRESGNMNSVHSTSSKGEA